MTRGARPTERSFGYSVGTVCTLLSLVAAWHQRRTAAGVLGAIGVVLVLLAFVRPSILRVPNAWWWRFAHLLGWVNTRVLLSVFYFVVLTPVAVVRRLGGWDPLQLKRSTATSGWLPYAARMKDPKHYEHMY